MATIMLNGEPIGVGGRLPQVGDIAHSFMLVDTNLGDVPLSKFTRKCKAIAVIPSIDTEVGLKIAHHLESIATSLHNTKSLIVSIDTPYALARAANAEGFRHIQLLSTMRGRDFHKDYGVMITDVPLSGMMATALFALKEDDRIVYSELARDVNLEPDFERMAEALAKP